MGLKTILKDEIESEMKAVSKLQVGSDDHKVAVDSAVKLIDKMIEIDKLEAERVDKLKEREFEETYKIEQMKAEKFDRWIKNGLTATGIAVSIILPVWGAIKTFEFEETGTITSNAGRNFISKLFKK